jgi:hypothetical protein
MNQRHLCVCARHSCRRLAPGLGSGRAGGIAGIFVDWVRCPTGQPQAGEGTSKIFSLRLRGFVPYFQNNIHKPKSPKKGPNSLTRSKRGATRRL